jgi:hypothetical protein
MVDWSSPTEIANDASESSSHRCPTILINIAQPLSTGLFTVFLACTCALKLNLSCYSDLTLLKLGMGDIPRLRLALYLWQKDIPLAHGVFLSLNTRETLLLISSHAGLLFPQSLLPPVSLDRNVCMLHYT